MFAKCFFFQCVLVSSDVILSLSIGRTKSTSSDDVGRSDITLSSVMCSEMHAFSQVRVLNVCSEKEGGKAYMGEFHEFQVVPFFLCLTKSDKR